jgi:hypothetical protein
VATFVQDSCTDVTGTVISSHIPQVGGPIVRHPSFGSTVAVITADGTIRSNSQNNTVLYYYTGAPASADYDVEWDFVCKSARAGEYPGVCFRLSTSAVTFYYVNYNSDTGTIALNKFVAGVNTAALGTGAVASALSAGQIRHVKVSIRNTSFSVYLAGSGTPSITATDSSIPTAGVIGVRPYATGVPQDTDGVNLDNIQAYDPVVSSPKKDSASIGASGLWIPDERLTVIGAVGD